MTTQERIRPIIEKTYGDNELSRSLVHDLALKLDQYSDLDREGEDRESMITRICWMWFSGGDTAASVARRIESELSQEPS